MTWQEQILTIFILCSCSLFLVLNNLILNSLSALLFGIFVMLSEVSTQVILLQRIAIAGLVGAVVFTYSQHIFFANLTLTLSLLCALAYFFKKRHK